MIKLNLKTHYKSEVVDVTNEIKEAVIKSGVKDGLVTIFSPHSSASVIIFENSDPSLKRELLEMLKNLISKKEFSHNNALAHLKASFLRSNITLIIENGKVVLGPWQGIYFVEFDGPRERNLYIKVVDG
jgi:secondary thiamine-phosphate synthase enzyme